MSAANYRVLATDKDAEIKVRVLEARALPTGDFACRIEYQPGTMPAHDIFGLDAEQADELAHRFVRRLFEGRILVREAAV